ncbi:MAG TPA: S8 family serine peptidase [Noviherbaspirillum sp.]
MAERSRDEEVAAIAPIMRMKLIAPHDTAPDERVQPAAQGVTWGVQAIGADTSPFTGDGIVVAVLDTGIDATHPAFNGANLIQKDFTGEGNGDEIGLGTHCAGTIFGRSINGVRIGVAPGVKKALIGKVLGKNGGSSGHICDAIQWAIDNGANVISMSLGIDFPGHVKDLTAQGIPEEVAVSIALEDYRKNVLLFEKLAAFVKASGAFSQAAVITAAAGNESRREPSKFFEVADSPPAVADGRFHRQSESP